MNLIEDAQKLHWLCGDVVEVEAVAQDVDHREEKGRPGYKLVEGHDRIKRHIQVEDGLPQGGDEVTAHGEEEQGEAE